MADSLPTSTPWDRPGRGGSGKWLVIAALCTAVVVAGLVVSTPDSRAASTGYKRAMTTLRLLSYDRNVGDRAGKPPTLLIVTPPNERPEDVQGIQRALERTSSNFEIAGERVGIQTWDYQGAEELETKLAELQPVALYVAAALGDDITEITKHTRQQSVLTFVPTRKMATDGAGVAIVSQSRGYQIVINLPAVRAEGVDFPGRVLTIADEVLR